MRNIVLIGCALLVGCTDFASHEIQNAARACGGSEKISTLSSDLGLMGARCMDGHYVTHSQIMDGG